MNGALSALYSFFVTKLPYITIAVFLLGVAYRLQRWLSAPKGPKGPPLHWPSALKYVVLDVVLFRKTYKTDKPMWFVLVLFHIGTGGILFGHMRGFHLWSASMFEVLGHGFAEFMVDTLPVYMGSMFLETQIILLITSILGQGMRVFPPEAIPTETYSVVFIPNLIVLHLEKVPSHHWFFWHVLFSQLLVMYLPWSKLVHAISGVVTSALYGSRRREYDI